MMQSTEARNTTGLFTSTTIQQFGMILLDLLFPPSCIHCGRVDTGFCETCYTELLHTPILHHTTTTESGIVVASSGEHSGVLQSAVQGLKYHNLRTLAIPLGKRLAQMTQSLDWTFDMVIPVPMHTSRYLERGYNQAQEIAITLAESIGCHCEPTAIERTRMTQSQVGLNREQRLSNLNDAFAAQAELVAGQTLLLVDDVQTTGTTISMCAEAAMQAGAARVYGMTVTAASVRSN
jgi:ComF family protein